MALLSTVSILLRKGRLADAETRLLDFHADSTHQQAIDGLWVTLLSLSGRTMGIHSPCPANVRFRGWID